MFMQLTGQDRAMDTVDVSPAHNERTAPYKPITDTAQTHKLKSSLPAEKEIKIIKQSSAHTCYSITSLILVYAALKGFMITPH